MSGTRGYGLSLHRQPTSARGALLSPPTPLGHQATSLSTQPGTCCCHHPPCPEPLQDSLLASDSALSAQLGSREQPGLPNEKQPDKTEGRRRKGRKSGRRRRGGLTGQVRGAGFRSRHPRKMLGMVVCLQPRAWGGVRKDLWALWLPARLAASFLRSKEVMAEEGA